MITKENYLPYDRVKVSKQMDFEISKAQFRDDQFYKDNGIDILKVSSASNLWLLYIESIGCSGNFCRYRS